MNVKKITPIGRRPAAPFQCQTIPPQRILVVEDERDIRQLNTEVLIDFGYKVDAAEDGLAAWQALNADGYDLLITDHDMPKVSGLELLKKLHAARMALPVIMVSETLTAAELKRNPWLQIHETLLKPYTVVELLGKVKEVLRANSVVRAPVASPANNSSRPHVEPLHYK
jgi:DNA-binding response OmpR family regulator